MPAPFDAVPDAVPELAVQVGAVDRIARNIVVGRGVAAVLRVHLQEPPDHRVVEPGAHLHHAANALAGTPLAAQPAVPDVGLRRAATPTRRSRRPAGRSGRPRMVTATSPCRFSSCRRTPSASVVAARSPSGPWTLRVIAPLVASSMIHCGSSARRRSGPTRVAESVQAPSTCVSVAYNRSARPGRGSRSAGRRRGSGSARGRRRSRCRSGRRAVTWSRPRRRSVYPSSTSRSAEPYAWVSWVVAGVLLAAAVGGRRVHRAAGAVAAPVVRVCPGDVAVRAARRPVGPGRVGPAGRTGRSCRCRCSRAVTV